MAQNKHQNLNLLKAKPANELKDTREAQTILMQSVIESTIYILYFHQSIKTALNKSNFVWILDLIQIKLNLWNRRSKR